MKKKNDDNTIIYNKKANFDFYLSDTLECGIVLQGWEVKSLRARRVQIQDSHVIIKKQEMFLLGSIINPLPTVSTHVSADSTRTRKLLLHQKELAKFIGQVERKGYTLVPVSLYWKKNLIKLKVALGKGKKQHDKRATIKDREWRTEQQRRLKTYNN